MSRWITALGVAALITTTSVGASSPAEAHYRHVGPGIIGGIIGGIALGTIIAAQRDAYYDDDYYPGYYGRPYYRSYYGGPYHHWHGVYSHPYVGRNHFHR
ncbi:MAG: hypothetical protein P4L82_15655 [Ancalomicrobiaceae bacterium]|nr:hypothetical protein [Ancalomicrobiaceae bacterium]